jgi:hypothetical protein
MDKILLETQEIESLKKLQEEVSGITSQLGEIEIQKQNLKSVKSQVLGKLAELRQAQQQLGVALNNKYGSGTIDLNSGEFTKSN